LIVHIVAALLLLLLQQASSGILRQSVGVITEVPDGLVHSMALPAYK